MSEPTPFLFGKLPAHGDFISRGLDETTERVWDDWASAELARAEAALGAGYASAHDSVPPWGFICGPGSLGDGWRAGAILASVDSVGRRFVVVAGFDGMTAQQAAFAGGAAVNAADATLRGLILSNATADWGISALEPPFCELGVAERIGMVLPVPGVWWTYSTLIEPVMSASPPTGLVSDALTFISDLMKEPA